MLSAFVIAIVCDAAATQAAASLPKPSPAQPAIYDNARPVPKRRIVEMPLPVEPLFVFNLESTRPGDGWKFFRGFPRRLILGWAGMATPDIRRTDYLLTLPPASPGSQ